MSAFRGGKLFLLQTTYRDAPLAGSGTTHLPCQSRPECNKFRRRPAFRPGDTGAIAAECLRLSTMKKEIRLNAFAMNCVAHQSPGLWTQDRKSTRLNSSHVSISYAVFCLKKKNINEK